MCSQSRGFLRDLEFSIGRPSSIIPKNRTSAADLPGSIILTKIPLLIVKKYAATSDRRIHQNTLGRLNRSKMIHYEKEMKYTISCLPTTASIILLASEGFFVVLR